MLLQLSKSLPFLNAFMRRLNPYAQESYVFCAIFELIPTFRPEFDKMNDISIDLFYK